MPGRFREVLRETQTAVGRDRFAYDGVITVATNVAVDPQKKRVAIELFPVPYSYHLASRRYGVCHGYDKAPYRAAISSVLLETREGLWVLAQRSTSVDISKGKAGFSAGGFVDPEFLHRARTQRGAKQGAKQKVGQDAFDLTALRELEEELGLSERDLLFLVPNVLIASWRKVEISYLATSTLSLEQVHERAATAESTDEHQRLIGVRPQDHREVLDRYGTWPGVREALAEVSERFDCGL